MLRIESAIITQPEAELAGASAVEDLSGARDANIARLTLANLFPIQQYIPIGMVSIGMGLKPKRSTKSAIVCGRAIIGFTKSSGGK